MINLLFRLMEKFNYICPITQQVYFDPVLADDGNIYERDAIDEWLKEKKTSPMTRERMTDKVVPVNFIKSLICEYLEKNPEMKDRQYFSTKDFKKYMVEVYEHIEKNRFEKLLGYKGYLSDKLSAKKIKIKVKELEFEIPYMKYIFKNCNDETVIKYILENTEFVDSMRYYMAEYSSEELNTKYIDKTDYYRLKTDVNKWHPLHFFVKRGFMNIIEAIGNIYTFKKYNLKTKGKYTPLMMGIKYNQQVIPILLNYKMIVSIDDIQFGIKNKLSYEIVKTLYDNCKDEDKANISIYVCRYGKYQGYLDFINHILNNIPTVPYGIIVDLIKYASDKIVKMFIDKGFSVNTNNKHKLGYCGWAQAILCKRYNLFRYMMPKIDPTVKTKKGSSMIHCLMDCNYQFIKEMSEKYEFDYNEIANDMTPLLWAIQKNNIKVCEFLLEKGADVNVKLEKKTALIEAIRNKPDDVNLHKLILSKYTDLDFECDGKYLIHHIGLNCKPDIIKLMMGMNINLESVDNLGRKLIHILCGRTDCDELIKNLIDVKNVSIEDYNIGGFKPMHEIFLVGSFEMIEYMKQKTKDHKLNPHEGNKYKEPIELLLDNPNVKNMVKAMFEID